MNPDSTASPPQGAQQGTSAPLPGRTKDPAGNGGTAGPLRRDQLKHVETELSALGKLLGTKASTVTENSDPRVAYAGTERAVAMLGATTFELNPELLALAQALDLAPEVVRDLLERQSEALKGYQVTGGMLADARVWQQIMDAALFLARAQVRSTAIEMLSDGSLDQGARQSLEDDLQEVLTLEGWTLETERLHQQELDRIMEAGAQDVTEAQSRRKLMQALSALRNGQEPDLSDLADAAALYQKYLTEAEGSGGAETGGSTPGTRHTPRG